MMIQQGVNTMMNNIKISIMAFMKDMRDRSISAFAGSTAFFFLLSAIPILVLLSMIISNTSIPRDEIEEILTLLIPVISSEYILDMFSEAFKLSGSILPLSIITLLWSCSRGMLGLTYGLNKMYDVHEDKGYFQLRLGATLYTFLLIVLLIIMVVLQVFGNAIMDSLSTYFSGMYLTIIFAIVFQFRYLILIGFGIVILSLIYTLVPGEKHAFLEQIPGATIAIIALIIFSSIFSLFTGSSHYSLYYGSLAVAIIGMIWLYWCIYIILIGGYINWYFRYMIQTLIDRIIRRFKKRRSQS